LSFAAESEDDAELDADVDAEDEAFADGLAVAA
jgi:hypothetical protein